ncbi:Uncharacterised protein [Achromobacter sp. 2789STDY5608633]|nr:Uncharacterised protein [Achromobacter sp. 2789STDY5608633]
MLARGGRELGFQRRQRLGLALQGPQHVQRHHVARAFPDGIDRRFTVQARHRPLFDVAVAAPGLHAFGHRRDRALADPQLGGRRADPRQRARPGVGALVHRARQPQRQRLRGLGLQRQVAQHVAHQRLRQQWLAEGVAVTGMVQRLHQRLAQQRGAAQHTIEPGGGGHLQQHRQAAARLAHHDAPGVLELDFGAGVAVVAQLVLQAADAHRVAQAARNPARHEKAAEPFVGLRQHQVGVGLRHRKEPFVAHQLISAAAPGRAQRRGAGGDRAQVGTALLFGQTHADQRAALARQRRIGAVEFTRIQRRQPVAAVVHHARRFALQQRHGGKGHGGRAQRAGLDLALHQIGRGPRHLRARHRLRPGAAVQAARHDAAHQQLPGRMEIHVVDAMAGPVVGHQPRRTAVGVGAGGQRLRPSKPGAMRGQVAGPGAGALARGGLAQRRVGVEQRIVFQGRDLVKDGMSHERRHADCSYSLFDGAPRRPARPARAPIWRWAPPAARAAGPRPGRPVPAARPRCPAGP